jgi:hypothetical protein
MEKEQKKAQKDKWEREICTHMEKRPDKKEDSLFLLRLQDGKRNIGTPKNDPRSDMRQSKKCSNL